MSAGVADDAASICKLAEAVYRGVLHALPASARAWFGDLRDRGLAAAVEVSQSSSRSHTDHATLHTVVKKQRCSVICKRINNFWMNLLCHGQLAGTHY